MLKDAHATLHSAPAHGDTEAVGLLRQGFGIWPVSSCMVQGDWRSRVKLGFTYYCELNMPVSKSNSISSISSSEYFTASEFPLSKKSTKLPKQKSGPLSGLNSLPTEITQQIAGEVGARGVLAMSLTSKNLRNQIPSKMVVAARITRNEEDEASMTAINVSAMNRRTLNANLRAYQNNLLRAEELQQTEAYFPLPDHQAP